MARQAGRRRAPRARGRAGRIEVAGHGHSHGEAADTSAVDADERVARRVRLVVFCLLVPIVIVTAVLTLKLWPSGDVVVDSLRTEQARGEVTALKSCARADECDQATVRLSHGPAGAAGTEVPVEVPKGQFAPTVHVGDRVMLNVNPSAPAAKRFEFVDQDRTRPLLLLAGLFAVGVVVLSRWRGLAALGALVVTAVVLTQFVLPAILSGSDPLLVAVVGGTLIMVLALYLTHGVNAQTSVALVGTVGALALTAVLGELFVRGSRITGLGVQEASTVSTYVEHLDIAGLLVAGVVIGALGVLDDVTVTQATAVWELSAANPAASRRALLSAGLRIGRAHVASVVNTLMLAYAGAALPLLMIFAISGVPGSYAVSTEGVAIEVIRGLVGSLGIIAAVPLTTALAALAVGGRTHPGAPPTPA